MSETIKITGMDQVLKTLAALPAAMRRKAMRQALRAGARVLMRRASANVAAVVSNEATGTLAKNLTVRSLRIYKGRLRYAVQIKPKAVNRKKTVKGQPVRVGLYGSVLEYGKKNQPPRSWLRKAAREGKDEALGVVTRTAADNLAAAVKAAQS